MYRILTEEESNDSNKKLLKDANDWWDSLYLKEKISIFNYHKDIFKQIKCTHEFHNISFYNSKIESCFNCGYTRNIDEIRDEKINDII